MIQKINNQKDKSNLETPVKKQNYPPDNKEQGIMLCPLCKEIIDIPNSYKEYFFKQGIQKAIDIIGEWRGQLEDVGFIIIDKHFVNELIEKLNQEVGK